MRTKIYFLSVMAFSLGININAQTNTSSAKESDAEVAENKRILMRLGGKTVPDNMEAESPLAVKSANISGESQRTELLKLAEALSYQSRRLKKEAETKTGNEKNQLLAEAAQYEKNCLLKQIEASEIFGNINQVKYNSNKESINKLIVTTKLEESKMTLTRKLIFSSQKNMQLAKDLRQEASSAASLPTKLGTMSNAEEKEILALGEQGKAIDILYKRPGAGM